MDTITFGLFHNQESAENAINELSRNGFSIQDITIVVKAEGLFAGLIGLGLAEAVARICEAKIEAGAVLLGIPTTSTERTVKEILQNHRASQIHSINRNVQRV